MPRVNQASPSQTHSMPPPGPSLLRLGSTGEAVTQLQTALKAAGFPVTANGTFDAATRDAVKAFQSSVGLKADGLVGELTRGKLASATPAPTPAPARGWGNAPAASQPKPAAGWAATGATPRQNGPVRTVSTTPLPPPKNAREAAVDAIPASELQVGGTARKIMRVGDRTLADRLPIVKGSYKLVADYTDPKSNHLYVVDKRDNKVVARYVSNGGVDGGTPGGDMKVNFKNTRPTWTPTADEMKENPNFRGDGPGPEGSMGLVKLNLKGAVYVHGVWDAETDGGKVSVDKDQLNDLGEAHSHGCWNMSNPNVVELVERFGVGEGTEVKVLKGSNAKAEAKRLDKEMADERLGDRPLSAGTDILEADYQGAGKYLSKKDYKDKQGTSQTDDGWYLRLWKRRASLGG